jgi:hypothetical protein
VLAGDARAVVAMPAAQHDAWTRLVLDRLEASLGLQLVKRVKVFR